MRSYSVYRAHTHTDPGDDRTSTAFTAQTLTSQLATWSACMQFGAAVAAQDALAGIAATAYVSLVPTGCVVETTTTLVRYFNPNKKPSPDFPMISAIRLAMHTGVAFRPACNVHIRGESMVTTSTQLMVSNNRKIIPAAVALTAAAVGGSYYFVGTDQHRFVSIKLL